MLKINGLFNIRLNIFTNETENIAANHNEELLTNEHIEMKTNLTRTGLNRSFGRPSTVLAFSFLVFVHAAVS
ncbi:hypothetical protein T09_480 [Trichinella sp. T9]|nr:hypothetical protein T09_480 [Trichinella sp. T9]